MTGMHKLWVSAAICAVVFVGCPSDPPAYAPAIIVSPTSLDIDADSNSATFTVSNVYTSKPLNPFTVSSSAGWASVYPATGTSTGPQDPVTITVAVDRDKLTSITSAAELTVSAEGVESRTVSVTARAHIVANFSANNTQVSVGQFIQFTDKSAVASDQSNIQTWVWDFGDSSELSYRQNPKHYYSEPGVYTVTLTVYNGQHAATMIKENLITIVEAE